jgi:fido (protein-threonine AMPylation protein)
MFAQEIYEPECYLKPQYICEHERIQVEVYQNDEMSLEVSNFLTQAKRIAKSNADRANTLFETAFNTYGDNPELHYAYGQFLEDKSIPRASHHYLCAYRYGKLDAKIDYVRLASEIANLDRKNYEKIDELARNWRSLKGQGASVPKDSTPNNQNESCSSCKNNFKLQIAREYHTTELLGLFKGFRYIAEVKKNGKENFLKNAEEILMTLHTKIFEDTDPEFAGVFRKEEVTVAGMQAPEFQKVPELMKEFFNWLRSEECAQEPIVSRVALAHYQIVYIHPFVNGNGRTARMLMYLLMALEAYPIVQLPESKRQEYNDKIAKARASKSGDIKPFIDFINDLLFMGLSGQAPPGTVVEIGEL